MLIINNRKYLDEYDLDVNTFGNLDKAKLYKEKLNKILKDSEFRKIIQDNIDFNYLVEETSSILEFLSDFSGSLRRTVDTFSDRFNRDNDPNFGFN